MAVKKLETLCETVPMGTGDFRENVRVACNKLLAKCVDAGGTFVDMEITKISGGSEITMLLITVVYSK